MRVPVLGYAALSACILCLILFGCAQGSLLMSLVSATLTLAVLSTFSPHEDAYFEVVGRTHVPERRVEKLMHFNVPGPVPFILPSVYVPKTEPARWFLHLKIPSNRLRKEAPDTIRKVPVMEAVYQAFEHHDQFPMYYGMSH